MKEKTPKIKMIILSMIFLVLCIKLIIEYKIIDALDMLLMSFYFNPYFWKMIFMKLGAKTIDYMNFIKIQSFGVDILIVFMIISFTFIFTDKEIINFTVLNSDIESVLKILYYFIYLFILYIYKSANKSLKYIVFGVHYFICVILSFASKSINNQIISILNHIPTIDLDFATYDLWINTCLIPIKEAILTYIIFDTIIENKRREL